MTHCICPYIGTEKECVINGTFCSMARSRIKCEPCNMVMDYMSTADDLNGNLHELYKCPRCNHQISIRVAGVEE